MKRLFSSDGLKREGSADGCATIRDDSVYQRASSPPVSGTNHIVYADDFRCWSEYKHDDFFMILGCLKFTLEASPKAPPKAPKVHYRSGSISSHLTAVPQEERAPRYSAEHSDTSHLDAKIAFPKGAVSRATRHGAKQIRIDFDDLLYRAGC